MRVAPIGPEWPSCHYNAKLSLMFSICVDDFKLAGKKATLPIGLKLLRQGLHIEPEQRADATGVVYLGCRQVVSTIK